MSVTTELQTIPEDTNTHLSDIWELKETISAQTGFLQQDHHFFEKIYQNNTTHILFDDSPIGFITVQNDGYILLLGVHPHYQERGYGQTLIEHAAETHFSLTCHTRTANTDAISFYKQLGFEISHTIEHYYEDNTNAYYLIREGDRNDVWDQWDQ